MGFEDETWWSRLAKPSLHAWSEAGRPLHLIDMIPTRDDPDPKALACYGMLLRWAEPGVGIQEKILLRFVEGQPVSGATTAFLAWSCERVQSLGKQALLMIWDNASWHISQEVRRWIRHHNQQVKEEGKGIRIIVCLLPLKSPWLNPIEPHWVHGKRKVVELDRLLTAYELADRVCACFDCPHEEHLSISEYVA